MDEFKTLTDWSRIHELDFLALFVGDELGRGISRITYAHKTDPTLVIKAQFDTERFQNQSEWKLWDDMRVNPFVRGYLAPCVAISPSGLWMLQKRTAPVTPEELKRRLPKVPACFTDLKAGNWGMLERRIVCHDYGTMCVSYSAAMRKADWW